MNERGKQNLALANDPNVRKYLEMIKKSEGTKGYDSGFNNVKLSNLDAHPGTSHKFKETDGKKNTTTAAGAYQFLKGTWDGVQGKLGLTDFGASAQDAAAVELLRQRGALDAIKSGDWSTALAKTGAEWASLPTSPYKQAKRSMDFVYNALGAKRPEGPVYKEFYNKMTAPAETMPYTEAPYMAAQAPAATDWQTTLVQDAQLQDDQLNKQQKLHEMFADSSTPQPKDDISLPPALRLALADIIRAV
jgi:muramidase (phage lysozyme)